VERAAWELRDDETPKSYAAFCIYRDLGPDRSVAKALEADGKTVGSRGYWEAWCSKYDWVDRAAAYDLHTDGLIRKRLEAKRMRAAEQQAELGEAMVSKARERLRTIDTSDLGAQDIARLADVGVKMQRLALGEPTEIGKQSVIIPNILEVTLCDSDDRKEKPAPRTE
jgi:hypothetical protein